MENKIIDAAGNELQPFDKVMVCGRRHEGASRLWRHDIFLDYDAERYPNGPYICASGFWPVAVKIDTTVAYTYTPQEP